MFGFLGSLASAIIPGVAPILGLAASAIRAFSGGGGAPTEAPIPLPPPPPPFDPRVGTVTPAMADTPFGGESNLDASGTALMVGGSDTAPSWIGDLPGASTTGFDVGIPSAPQTYNNPISALIGLGQEGLNLIRPYITPQNVAIAGGVVAGGLALRFLPKALMGTALGNSVTALYNGLRQRGMSHKHAKRVALEAHGVRLRRRRMRPTNVVALRRAIRRVRGARRIMSKVRALHVGGRGGGYSAPRRRRRSYRRGDLPPFFTEDRLNAMDEWEDEGGEPDTFPDEETA